MRYSTAWLTLGVTACTMGSSPQSYPLARRPAGAEVTITTTDRTTRRGELLVVDDTAAVVLTPSGEVRWFPLHTVTRLSTRPGSVSLDAPRGIENLDAESRRRLQLVSRFPYGVSPDILADIAAHPTPTAAQP